MSRMNSFGSIRQEQIPTLLHTSSIVANRGQPVRSAMVRLYQTEHNAASSAYCNSISTCKSAAKVCKSLAGCSQKAPLCVTPDRAVQLTRSDHCVPVQLRLDIKGGKRHEPRAEAERLTGILAMSSTVGARTIAAASQSVQEGPPCRAAWWPTLALVL
jgi:predicted small lipoprotein YifL